MTEVRDSEGEKYNCLCDYIQGLGGTKLSMTACILACNFSPECLSLSSWAFIASPPRQQAATSSCTTPLCPFIAAHSSGVRPSTPRKVMSTSSRAHSSCTTLVPFYGSP